MKKLIATAVVSGLATLAVLAQGTISFVNLNAGSGVNAPVFQMDGATKLVGPNYVAQLFYSATAGGTMTAVGSPVAFLTGGGAGYFNGGTITLPGIAGGATAYLMVAAWDSTLAGTTTGATEAAAFAYWQGNHGNVWGASGYNYNTLTETPFAVVTGNPTATPPGTPANLVGLTSFSLAGPVPEPTTMALLGLGAAGVLMFRRRS